MTHPRMPTALAGALIPAWLAMRQLRDSVLPSAR